MDNDAPIPAIPAPPPNAPLEKLLHGEILSPELRPLVEGPVSRAVAEAADYAKGALSAATRRAYLADWTDFAAWCRAGGAEPLPASPVVVAGYLASLAKTLGRSGLKRRLAAIAHFHRAAGHIWLPGHPYPSDLSHADPVSKEPGCSRGLSWKPNRSNKRRPCDAAAHTKRFDR